MRSALLVGLASVTWGCGMHAPREMGTPGGADTEVSRFVEQMNVHRQAVGCRSLAWHSAVAEVAEAHSRDMRDRRYFGHTDRSGRGFADRLDDAGIPWHRAGENVARTPHGADQVLTLWLRSPGHRLNIENCRFTHHGVGRVGEYWTHLFVTPPSPS